MNTAALLRLESRRLRPLAEALRRTAGLVEKVDVRAVRRAVDDAHSFLAEQFVPHVVAEAVALSHLIDSEVSALSRDCRELVGLTQELNVLRGRLGADHPTAQEAEELRRVLYGLYALARAFFVKSDEVYLPMLDAVRVAQQGVAALRLPPLPVVPQRSAARPSERSGTAGRLAATGGR